MITSPTTSSSDDDGSVAAGTTYDEATSKNEKTMVTHRQTKPRYSSSEDEVICKAIAAMLRSRKYFRSRLKLYEHVHEEYRSLYENEMDESGNKLLLADQPLRTLQQIKQHFETKIKPSIFKFNKYYIEVNSVMVLSNEIMPDTKLIHLAALKWNAMERNRFRFSSCVPILHGTNDFHPDNDGRYGYDYRKLCRVTKSPMNQSVVDTNEQAVRLFADCMERLATNDKKSEIYCKNLKFLNAIQARLRRTAALASRIGLKAVMVKGRNESVLRCIDTFAQKREEKERLEREAMEKRWFTDTTRGTGERQGGMADRVAGSPEVNFNDNFARKRKAMERAAIEKYVCVV